jgi:hypothetical protein
MIQKFKDSAAVTARQKPFSPVRKLKHTVNNVSSLQDGMCIGTILSFSFILFISFISLPLYMPDCFLCRNDVRR